MRKLITDKSNNFVLQPIHKIYISLYSSQKLNWKNFCCSHLEFKSHGSEGSIT